MLIIHHVSTKDHIHGKGEMIKKKSLIMHVSVLTCLAGPPHPVSVTLSGGTLACGSITRLPIRAVAGPQAILPELAWFALYKQHWVVG